MTWEPTSSNIQSPSQQPFTSRHYYQQQHQQIPSLTNNRTHANQNNFSNLKQNRKKINVNGINTTIIADVTTNLVTNLILGSDWIQANNVYILTPEQRIMIRSRTFSTQDGHFQFKVLPHGLTNGPPTFQRIVNQILGPNRCKHVLAYIDDIIIYSQNFNEHLKHIEEVCSLLHEANFKLNVDKCEVSRTEILFLGHLIKAGTIKPDPNNIRGLTDTQEPTSAEEAFRFVKAAEYYRKFIPKFSIIAAPLHQYSPETLQQQKINKKLKFELSVEARTAFHQLKKTLTTDLILDLPDDTLPFKLQTDASVDGIGAVLLQITPNGDRPLAYMSKKLTKTQTNWPTIEQE
ncbi:unnamed protein product [Rotaria sp. Silwood2]|nr:unnamed protein product [Rotaria sp. Silwood2]